LSRLRQKHDVNDELDDMVKAFDEQISINLFFRFVFVSILQMVFAIFMSNALLLRVKVQTGPTFPGEQTSTWMVYFGLMNLIGVFLSIMTVDNVRRKTILKDVLPFCGAVAIACGILGITDNQNNTLTQIALMALFIGGGLSLTCSVWLTAIEIFPPYRRDRFVAWSFGIFYLVLALIYLLKPSFGIIHFIFAALCFILTGVLFAMCASTPDGAIELKKEKKERKKREEYLENVSSYVARVSRSQSFLRSRVRRSSSRYVTRTPREGVYENFESPAANEQTLRRPQSSKANGLSRSHDIERKR
jgi:callose synthase